jgi:ribosomal protein L37AE/L43A
MPARGPRVLHGAVPALERIHQLARRLEQRLLADHGERVLEQARLVLDRRRRRRHYECRRGRSERRVRRDGPGVAQCTACGMHLPCEWLGGGRDQLRAPSVVIIARPSTRTKTLSCFGQTCDFRRVGLSSLARAGAVTLGTQRLTSASGSKMAKLSCVFVRCTYGNLNACEVAHTAYAQAMRGVGA